MYLNTVSSNSTASFSLPISKREKECAAQRTTMVANRTLVIPYQAMPANQRVVGFCIAKPSDKERSEALKALELETKQREWENAQIREYLSSPYLEENRAPSRISPDAVQKRHSDSDSDSDSDNEWIEASLLFSELPQKKSCVKVKLEEDKESLFELGDATKRVTPLPFNRKQAQAQAHMFDYHYIMKMEKLVKSSQKFVASPPALVKKQPLKTLSRKADCVLVEEDTLNNTIKTVLKTAMSINRPDDKPLNLIMEYLGQRTIIRGFQPVKQ